jgi:hypothetical protein
MSGSESVEPDLLKLIEHGVSRSADKLAMIARAEWSTQTVSVTTGPPEGAGGSPNGGDKEMCGTTFTLPGGVFLVMFPARGAADLARAFLPDGAGAVEHREAEALAEISNIAANEVAAAIADACGAAFLLSAPKQSRGRKSELLKAAADAMAPDAPQFVIKAAVHMGSAAFSSDCVIAVFLSVFWKERLLAAL